MRRLGVIAALVAVLGTAAVLAGAGSSGDHYRVRAIFDTAAFIVPGEDVKVAGVRAGKIESLHVTPDKRAAVVLDITDPSFQDFREDATCAIRPQSLIGEQFVECTPTQPRSGGASEAPELKPIESGDGEGQVLLPVEQTRTTVALDLIGNTMRLPVRERLTIILGELGVGLAGRGDDLNQVIRRAAPALDETSKVLKLVAEQNKVLKRLAVDSDRILEPLARERKHISGFIEESTTVASATADRREELAQNFQKLPTFLAELRPTMVRLGALADDATPVLRDLRVAAPDIDDLLRETGPFTRVATPALVSLGEVGDAGIPAIRAALPIQKDLRELAAQLKPVGALLADTLTSFQRNDGIERLLDYIYFQVQAINGFDTIGHFLRAGLIVNTCSTYATTSTADCRANFSSASASRASVATTADDPLLRRTAAALAGTDAEKLVGEEQAARNRRRLDNLRAAIENAPAPTATPEPPESEPAGNPVPSEPLLDFLFGGEDE